jgi:heme-degrading monooxygenase HmoA
MPGYVGMCVYQLDRDSNEYVLVVAFKDKESYHANAGSAEQDRRYRQMRELLESDPEWMDGEIVWHSRLFGG